MIRGNKGFSLIELMVVVAIIGVLSMLAIPQVNKYVARARQTEAKTNLAGLYTSNKAFFAEYGIYDTHFDAIGFRPEGKLRYNTGWAGASSCNPTTYGFTGQRGTTWNAASHCGTNGVMNANGCSVLADGQGANGTLVGTAIVCATSFTAGAAGKISSGGTPDRWTVDQNKDFRNTQDGTQ